MLRYVQVTSPADVELARELFKEYQASLGIDLCFQDFEEELAQLPGEYTPPSGRLLLAYWESQLTGCVALKRIDEVICEMKRLYVRPAFRGKRICSWQSKSFRRPVSSAMPACDSILCLR